jgi:hypothetical protein
LSGKRWSLKVSVETTEDGKKLKVIIETTENGKLLVRVIASSSSTPLAFL